MINYKLITVRRNNIISFVTLKKDEDIACIKDINPASTHHYLIIPKVHIVNAKCLKKDDEPLCKSIL